MKPSHVVVSAVGAVLAIGSIAVQPLGTMKSLESAIANRDVTEVRELVDFPRLRENVKYQLRQRVSADAETVGTPRAMEEIINALGGALLDQIVTPEKLIEAASQMKASELSEPSYRYDSISKFSGVFPTKNGEPIKLVLERQGLSWRLVDVTGLIENYIPVPQHAEERSQSSSRDDEGMVSIEDGIEGESSRDEKIDADGMPSYDCRQAKKVSEKTICGNDNLARVDVYTSKMYRCLLAAENGSAVLKGSQRKWISERDKCEDDIGCLRMVYGDIAEKYMESRHFERCQATVVTSLGD